MTTNWAIPSLYFEGTQPPTRGDTVQLEGVLWKVVGITASTIYLETTCSSMTTSV